MRTFHGRTLVDLREHFLKNEQPAPGKKGMQIIRRTSSTPHAVFTQFLLSSLLQAGIALTEEQWGVVGANAASISAALAAHDATFELPLGSERRLQVPVV